MKEYYKKPNFQYAFVKKIILPIWRPVAIKILQCKQNVISEYLGLKLLSATIFIEGFHDTGLNTFQHLRKLPSNNLSNTRCVNRHNYPKTAMLRRFI